MKLTDIQKSIVKDINERSVSNITSFFNRFCEFEIKDIIGILDNVDIYYLSVNPNKNYMLCQEFMILLDKLTKNHLIALSPDESDERFLVFTSEDGPQPAQVDTKLLKIISAHLNPYDENIHSISNGVSVSREIIPLPALADFIEHDFLTEPEYEKRKTPHVDQTSQDTKSTAVSKIDTVKATAMQFKRAPLLTSVILLFLVVVAGFLAYINGFFAEKGKQAASQTEVLSQKGTQQDSSNKLADNEFFDFRIINESGCKIEIEIWYLYNGALGNKDISIDVNPLNKNGEPLPGGAAMSGTEVLVVGTKAVAKLDYAYRPSSNELIDKSMQIEFCMSHFIKGVFYCQSFPYEKEWNCKAKESRNNAL